VSQFATSELNSPVTAASEATSHMYSTSDVVAAGTSVKMISATTTTIKSPLSEYQSLSNTSLTIGMLTYKCVIVYKYKIIFTDVPAATTSEVEYICEVASEAAVTGEFNSEVANCDTGLVVVKVSENVDMDNLVLEAESESVNRRRTDIYYF
jgi:hypothetical protein